MAFLNYILPLHNTNISYENIGYIPSGSVLLSNNHKSKTFIFTPSPIKHGSIFFGKGIYNKIKKLIHDIKKYLNIQKDNSLLSRSDIKFIDICNTDVSYLIKIESVVDIGCLLNKLIKIVETLTAEDDDINYIVEICDKGPRVMKFYNFVRNKHELFIYKYHDDSKLEDIAYFSLCFLGTNYSFIKARKNKYCYEMIMKTHTLADPGFKPLKVKISFEYHYTSLSFSKSNNFVFVKAL